MEKKIIFRWSDNGEQHTRLPSGGSVKNAGYTMWKEPKLEKPTMDEVLKAIKNGGKLEKNQTKIFSNGHMVEVRKSLVNGLTTNTYRDFYEIINQ